MTRTINATGYDDQRAEFVYLYELRYSSGTLFLTNASADIVVLGQTWDSTNGHIVHEPTSEQGDSRAQGVSLDLFGVDQSIISVILANNFRGRLARIYLMHFDPDTGVAQTPDLIWQGRQMGDYEIEEDRDSDISGGGSVRVTTTIASSLSVLNVVSSVRANVVSHREMLRRGGLAVVDKFFERVPAIMSRELLWGTEQVHKGRFAANDAEAPGYSDDQ